MKRTIEFVNGWKLEIHNEGTIGQFYCATKNGKCRTSVNLTYLRRNLK
ncbi:hypothetical protein GWN42_21695 [candidate division KSB1 bacterium]|nr:hypothetical protein [candidate division KSB1 bacterium]